MFTSSIAGSLLSIANSLKKLAETEEYEAPTPQPPCTIPHREENDKYGFYEDV